jgi:hypothetical protein
MTAPASPPPRRRMPSRPEYAGPERRAPSPVLNQLEIDVTQALATAERVEQALQQRGAKSSVGWIAGIVLACLPTFATVYQAYKAPPPPPPALTSEDARLIRAGFESLQITVREQATEIKALRSAVDRQEGARMARERD